MIAGGISKGKYNPDIKTLELIDVIDPSIVCKLKQPELPFEFSSKYILIENSWKAVSAL